MDGLSAMQHNHKVRIYTNSEKRKYISMICKYPKQIYILHGR